METYQPDFLSCSHVWEEGVLGGYKVIRELVGLVTSLQPRAPASTMDQA